MTDSDDLTGPCQHCGADADTAFVRYHADMNDAQERSDWGENVASTLYSLVCMECGMGRAALDPRENPDLPDFEDLPKGEGSESFRVDDELE